MTTSEIPSPKSQIPTILALIAILLVAGALRFYALDLIPPGLHYDEAFEAVNAREIVRTGQLHVFYEGNYGVEPLFITLVAGSFALLGESAWAVRAVAALAGVLTVLTLYLLAREMTSPPPTLPSSPSPHLWRGGGGLGGRGEVVPLLAAFLLAVSCWHITYSRTGIEPILVPLVETLCFLCFWWGLRAQSNAETHRKAARFALSGAFLGLGIYTYPAFRMVPILMVSFWGYLTLTQRGWLRRNWLHLALLVLAALLVFAPLGLYFAANPLSLSTRPGQIASLSPEAVLANMGRVAGMFTFAGDPDPRNNLPGRPVLDVFLSVGFLLGLGLCVWRWRRPAYAFPVLWLLVMLIPTILSEYAPHFRRAIGAAPAVALITALGLTLLVETVWAAARRLGPRLRPLARGTVLAGLGVGLLASTTLTIHDYFLVWGPSPDLFHAYDEGLAHVAQYVAALPGETRAYLSPVSTSHNTIQFFLRGRPLASFDGRRVQVLPPAGQEAVYVVIVHEDQLTLPWLRQIYPAGQVVWSLNDRAGAPYATAYRVPAGAAPALTPTPVGATVGDFAVLVGYEGAPATVETVRVTLHWQCRATTAQDYTVSVQLLGPTNPATGGPLWAQADAQPGGGTYPTGRWQPGETVLDSYTLTVPADAPAGDYRLVAGMYLLATLERLPATDAVGIRYPDDVVPLTVLRRGEEPDVWDQQEMKRCPRTGSGRSGALGAM